MATGLPISGGDLDDLSDAFNNRRKTEDLEAAKSLLLLHGEVATSVTDDEKSAAENGAKIHGPHGLPPKQEKEKSLQYNRWKKEEIEEPMSFLLLSVGVADQKPVSENGAGTSASHANNRDLDLLPDQVRNRIESLNGTEIAFVMQKILSGSDLNRNQNRLSFNENKVQNVFLTQEEVDKVGRSTRGLEVTVIQPCLEIIRNVELRKRSKNDGRYFEFVLIRNWFQIAENKRNGLKKKNLVRLWSFRMGPDLCFALVKA